VTRRVGRWVYNSGSSQYGEAGWNLTGSVGRGGKPVVIDFMPGAHDCCIGGPDCCRGNYHLYNFPGKHDHYPVARHLRYAMEEVEEMWDNREPDITSITREELTEALRVLAERTGNGDAYYPDLARCIFNHVGGERILTALAGIGGGKW
jgi:hypothetical protein